MVNNIIISGLKLGTHRKELLFKILLRIIPRCNSVTEEEEIINNALRIESNDVAYPPESTILLLIIANISQRQTPENGRIRLNHKYGQPFHAHRL